MRTAREGNSNHASDRDRNDKTPRFGHPMASQRQIDANRRNSTRSSGPLSTEGRAAAARNAIVHGLTAEKFGHLEDVAIIATRLDEWKHELKPDGAYQQWFAHRAVTSSVRVDRARL